MSGAADGESKKAWGECSSRPFKLTPGQRSFESLHQPKCLPKVFS
jgi:hypothetical protein